MKLSQLQEIKINRAKRRYQYLADKRLETFGGQFVEVDTKFSEGPSYGAMLTCYFFRAPWRTTDMERERVAVKHDVVRRFAEKFADDHGIPYTEIECDYQLLSIRYYYK